MEFHFAARDDMVSGEPPPVNLNSVHRGIFRHIRYRGIQGLHIVYFPYDAEPVNIGDAEWNKGVLHPEIQNPFTLEHKQHAAVRSQRFSVDEPMVTFHVGAGDFNIETYGFIIAVYDV